MNTFKYTEDGKPYERQWLGFTDKDRYHIPRQKMLDAGMNEKDVESILLEVWKDGWYYGSNSRIISLKPVLDEWYKLKHGDDIDFS